MSTYTLDLAFRPGNYPERAGEPTAHGPQGYIVLKRCSRYKVPFARARVPRLMDVLSLGPCLCEKELEHQADRLIEELREIKKKGKRNFKEDKKRRLAWWEHRRSSRGKDT